MDILIHSNSPAATSGYGQQVALLAPRLRDAGHRVGISAFFGVEGSMQEWDGMPVYPTDTTRLGKIRLPDYANHFAGKGRKASDILVLTLMDLWGMIDPRFGGPTDLSELRMASWLPVDHEPIPPQVLRAISHTSTRVIAMSKFGRDLLKGERINDTLYVPHSVDTNIYKPGGGEQIRDLMKIPRDAFVVGMVANNQGWAPSRKSFDPVFQAFSFFLQEHEDSYLYLHTDMLGLNDGINLYSLSQICGIPPDHIINVDPFQLHVGAIDPSLMATIYSSFDVLANPSHGEGFGIPIVEAQACGVPVIVTDFTAMPELCGAGWKVLGDRFYDSTQGSFYMRPSVMEIYEAFELAYEAKGTMGDRAREFALQYDADLVFEECWKPVLEELEKPRQVGPLNRAQRRAKKTVAA